MAKPVMTEQRRKIHTLEDSKRVRAREGHSQWKTSKEDEWLFSSTQNVKQHSTLGINKEHCWLWGYHQTLSGLETIGKICSFYLRVNFLSGRQFWPESPKPARRFVYGRSQAMQLHLLVMLHLSICSFFSSRQVLYIFGKYYSLSFFFFFTFFFFISDRKLSIYFKIS